MINLRYHIVSIVAVFLALGIGLALGSTFVDSVLVSNLEGQVNQLEADTQVAIDERDDAVARLEGVLETRNEFEALAEPVLATARYDDTATLIIAPDSVDRGEVDRLRSLLVSSNTDFAGILWLTPSFDLADETLRTALAEEFDLAGSGEGAVRRAVTFLVTQALFAPEEAGETGDTVPTALATLRDAGVVVYDPSFGGTSINLVGRPNLRLLVITDAEATGINSDIIFPLLREIAGAGFDGSTLVVELETAPGFGAIVGGLRADPELAAAFSSIDGVESFEGTLALSIALDELPVVAHYGQLPDADSRLPE